jgi:hypothetical protein
LGFKDCWVAQPLPDRILQEFNFHLNLPQNGTTILGESAPATRSQLVYDNLPKGYNENSAKRKFKIIV